MSCTAEDDYGNVATAGFVVNVVDGTAPVISFTDDPLVAYADSSLGATVDFSGNITVDDVDPSPSLVCSPASGSQFGFGLTTVSCTATDASGNEGSGSFDVSVQYLPLSGLDNNVPQARRKRGQHAGADLDLSGAGRQRAGQRRYLPAADHQRPVAGREQLQQPVDPDDPPGTPVVEMSRGSG